MFWYVYVIEWKKKIYILSEQFQSPYSCGYMWRLAFYSCGQYLYDGIISLRGEFCYHKTTWSPLLGDIIICRNYVLVCICDRMKKKNIYIVGTVSKSYVKGKIIERGKIVTSMHHISHSWLYTFTSTKVVGTLHVSPE
jgi:hypothetical protein